MPTSDDHGAATLRSRRRHSIRSASITSGKSGYEPLNGAVAGSDTLIEYIKQARRDSSVRAIVLRIDSPGGSTTATDVVWRELSIQMRDGGAAVAEAARKNDPAALHKAADRLESSCTACHSAFRP